MLRSLIMLVQMPGSKIKFHLNELCFLATCQPFIKISTRFIMVISFKGIPDICNNTCEYENQ